MLEEDIYTYRLWDWVSKSTVIADDFCEWLFYLRYLKGEKIEVGLSAHTGTNMHATMARFFGVIEISKLAKIPINYEEPLEEGRVFNFMLKTVMEIIPVDSREYTSYKKILTNFALMEADHWIGLNEQFNGNISTVIKYFMPNSVERFIELRDVKLFGTIDLKYKHYSPKKDFHELYDYKTGHVPKDIKSVGMKDIGDEFSWTLQTNKMFELHFYIILDMCRRGFTIHPDLIKYITDLAELNYEVTIPKVDSFFFDKKGKPYDFTKDYHIGIVYLGDKLGPFVPKKKSNNRSMYAVFRRIHNIRTKVYTNHAFEKKPNYWKCKNCTITERCLNELEMGEMKLEPKRNI